MNRVLIVDDEPDIHEILTVYLSRKDIEVENALTGEEGVKMYRKMFEEGRAPDLVIMDLNLSGENPDAVIWGYTAWSDTEWAERLRKAGAKKVVKRLVSFREFAEMVAEED